MSSVDDYSIEILNRSIAYLYQYIVPVLFVFGNIGNLISLYIFSKKSWRKNVCVFYFNICVYINLCYINSDLLASIFIFGYNINLLNSNIFFCKAYYYVTYLFTALLPTTLILASIDRLLISSQNIDTRLYSSKRLGYFSVSVCTFVWSVFYLHTLIKMNIQEFYPSFFICYFDPPPIYLYFVSYSLLIFDSLLYLIMIILCILAFKNVRRIRAIPRQQRNEIRTMNKKDFQLLRCLFVHDMIYIIFSLALNVSVVYQAVTIYQMQTPLEQAIPVFFSCLSIFLHHIPYCASFYVFIIVSKAFRNELKRTIYKIFGKDIRLIREEEHQQGPIGKDNIDLNVAVVNHVVPS